MRKAMTRARLFAVAAALLLAGCDGGKETPGTSEPSSHVPDVAMKVPAVTAEPDLTRRDLSFTGNDADGDGRVTPAEYAAAAQRFFAAVDTGDDGTLNLEEMETAGRVMGIADRSLSQKTIVAADNDGDGKLTLAEFIAFVNQRFARTDENGDGWLSPDEFSRGFAEVPGAAGTPPRPLTQPPPLTPSSPAAAQR